MFQLSGLACGLDIPCLVRYRFCSQCLRDIRPSEDGSLDCPICRQPFLMAGSFRDKELEREVKAATFECRGCKNKVWEERRLECCVVM